MKKISSIILLLLLVITTSCTKEEVTKAPFSDFTWYTSIPNSLPYTIKKGTNISFIDLSQGTLTHAWTIQEGNSFLAANFVKGQDLTPYIIPNKGLTTSDVTVHVLFPTAGTYTVALRNTFNVKVVYQGLVPIEAVQEGNVWVAQKVFTVTVTD